MSEPEPLVDANAVHAAALAVHGALLAEAERRGYSVTALGAGWDPDAREGWVDTSTTTLAEALLRAGWHAPPPAAG